MSGRSEFKQADKAGSGGTPVEGGLASRTLVGAAWLLIWRFVSRSLGLVSTLILARLLVPGDFGIVAMATTFAAAVDTLSELGLQDALVRRVGDDRKLYNTAFTLQVGRSLVTSLFVICLAPTVAWWFNEPRLIPVLLVLAAASLVGGVENIGIVEFRRNMRFDRQVRLLFVPRLLQVAVTIPAALLLQSYWALLIGIVTAKVARTVMTYVIHPYRPRLRIAGWRELAGFSFWTWASCVAGLVWERVDPFVLGPVIGPAQLGMYLLAAELALLPSSEMVAPAADALFAGFASAQKRGEGSFHHAPLVGTMLVLCVAPLAITISCASGYVVAALLGPQWVSAAPLVAIMAWMCMFAPFSFVGGAALVANNHVRRNFVARVLMSGLKLAVLLLAVTLSPSLVVISAAMTACVCTECVLYLLLLRGLGDIRLRPMFAPMLRCVLATALVVLFLWEAGLAWNVVVMPSVLAFLHGAGIGALAGVLYAALIYILWFLAGRPPGPETRLAELVGNYLRPLALRFSSRASSSLGG